MNRNESLDGPVIRLLHIIWKQACRQFPHVPVISEALATLPLSAARFVRAIAVLHVELDIALQGFTPLSLTQLRPIVNSFGFVLGDQDIKRLGQLFKDNM